MSFFSIFFFSFSLGFVFFILMVDLSGMLRLLMTFAYELQGWTVGRQSGDDIDEDATLLTDSNDTMMYILLKQIELKNIYHKINVFFLLGFTV